ncbi:family 43 putative glycoside hydrolase [Triangularia verruculosa]|uniref:Family 43 putative glycoside hydrolase n=1 Tax=Triangularia verruculosa TaxID=2587418 RepID=A0AAN7ARS0_9PEZI|nr:family 43 putative glycoside hydrolase [Triangularia verruculosa]
MFLRAITTLFLAHAPLVLSQTLTNPVVWQDHPDLDVFRIGRTFYYSSSTFAYSPGAPVLRSFDLANWEAVTHSVPYLNFSPANNYNLTSNSRAYVKGIWASTLRYRPSTDTFYWLGCIDGGKTHVWSSPGGNARANGGEVPTETWNWTPRPVIDKCYYDAGLFFDDDDSQVYVVYGNTQIRVAQLSVASNGDLREVRNQLVYTSSDMTLEGARMYKRNGEYWIWVTRPADAQFVLRANNPWGPYTRRVLVERIQGPLTSAGYAHQGGIVDTEDGRWFYAGFMDAYPGGRIPVVAPLTWGGDGWPSLVRDSANGWGKTYPIPVATTRKVNVLGPRVDEFRGSKLGPEWEWNHNPDNGKWNSGDGLVLRTATVTGDLFAARNTLTHRIVGPKSRGTFRIDVGAMRDGDRAGAVLFRDRAAYIGLHKTGNTASLVMVNNLNLVEGSWTTSSTGSVVATGPSVTGEIWLRIQADITPAFGTNTGRQAIFSYSTDGRTFTTLGPAFAMSNSWRYFTGYRFGVFNFATKALGGEIKVKSFAMELV